MRAALRAVLLWTFVIGGSAHAAVRAWLDTSQTTVGGSVQLTLQRDGQTSSQPDLAPLKQDFSVLSVGTSNNLQIINGSISSQTQAQIELSPKRPGTLTVPAIQWGGEASPPLVLQVGGSGTGGNPAAGGTAGGTAAGAGGAVFVETTVDTKTPYVQSAVDVTVRVYAAEPLYQGTLDFPTDDDVLMQRLSGDEHSSTVRDGQTYDVVTRHYVFFAQRNGPLTIPGATLDGEIEVAMRSDPLSGDPFARFFGGMMTGTKRIRVQGPPIVLDVRPRPAAAGNGPWLPATGLELTASWQPPSLRVEAGNPITLDLHLTAGGLAAAQLPDLASMLPLPPGLKDYPDDAKLSNAATGGRIAGTRDQSIALIADRPGRYVIPALHLAWWNTATDQAQSVEVPAQTIEVSPVPGGVAATSGAAPSAGANAPPPAAAATTSRAAAPPGQAAWRTWFGGDRRWIGVSAALGLLWVATMVGWWVSRRRAPAPVERKEPTLAGEATVAGGSSASTPATETPLRASRARAQFQAACGRHDAMAARRALLAWATAAWPDERVSGLQALAKRLGDPETRTAIAELERACYAGGVWDGSALAARLTDLPKPTSRTDTHDPPIAPLYR
ncbi:MAG: protein BatD [Gammaproteobacteria bacterium]|nr:protein BatD [Gammaproteobacteria bacterium]